MNESQQYSAAEMERMMKLQDVLLKAMAKKIGSEPLLVGQSLPALHDYVRVLRIEFHSTADPFGDFGGGQCCATTHKRFVHQLATLRMVQDRAPHQIDRLLRWVIEFRFVRSTHDEFRRWRVPYRRVLTGLAEPGSVLFLTYQHGSY